MKHAIITFIICSILNIASGSVTFEFSGYLGESFENNNDAIPGIMPFQPFTGWISYSFVPDTSSDASYGNYSQDASISVSIGSRTYSYLDKFVYITTLNGNDDRFRFAVDDALDEEINVTIFGIDLIDYNESVFDTDELPHTLNLADFDTAVFDMTGRRYHDGQYDRFDLEGTITELTLVSEPATLLLFALGGLCLKKKP